MTLPVASTTESSVLKDAAYLFKSRYCPLLNLWLWDSKLVATSAGLLFNSNSVSTSDSTGCPFFNISWSCSVKLSILILLAIKFCHPPGSANAISFALLNAWLYIAFVLFSILLYLISKSFNA